MHRNKILVFAQSLAVIPILAINVSFPSLAGMQGILLNDPQKEAINIKNIEQGKIIDDYFSKRDMPLEGYGTKMAQEAEKNGIDWRLLPAIAIRESSGGKNTCENNPFGWDSCRTDFDSLDEAIEVVAWNLGGNNPKTKKYYSGTTPLKLHHYNGTVVRKYTAQVLAIMSQIGDEE